MSIGTEVEVQVPPDQRVAELLAMYGDPAACAAELLCDQHAPESTAYRVVDADLRVQTLTYGQLREASERFARGLAGMGIGPGDRVATLMGKSVEQLIALVGIWRLGAVQVPMFTAFAAGAIAVRLEGSHAKVVICDADQRSKLLRDPADLVSPIPADPSWRVIVVGEPGQRGDVGFEHLLRDNQPGYPAVHLGGDAPIVHIYTSGTTGKPKGVVVPTRALASFHAYMEFGFGLGQDADDVFWNGADPGWAYGLYFGVIGSLCLGVPSVFMQGGASPERTWAVLTMLGVTNYTAAPTVYRGMRASRGPALSQLSLRAASAAGEPLTPEVNAWAPSALGVPVYDHFGQTEVGMVVNNHHHPALRKPLRPGSMGQVMPGWAAGVLYDDRDELAPPGTIGRLALDLHASPLAWFHGYVDEPEKSAAKFTDDGRWYITGDSARIDEDGYVYFLSRDDDLIIMAGYRIGPFDVESVLVTHPAVAEAAVISAPDELRGEVLEACVVLTADHVPTPELGVELQQLVKTRYAAHAYPRAVHFLEQLPKTPSGKVQRNVLRQDRREQLARESAAR